MKVVILAGGKGTRLGQQSDFVPKPMVLIGGKPILWHIMKFYSCQGFNEFVVCLGEKAHVIKEYFANYGNLYRDFTLDISSGNVEYHTKHTEGGWKVTLVDTGIDTLKGGRIKRIEKYLDSDVNMLTYGDGLSDVSLPKLLDYHHKQGKIVTVSAVRQPSRFGELAEKDGSVLTFTEKPLHSDRRINGGFMVFNRKLLDFLTESENCDFEIGALDLLARNGQVAAYHHDGDWECVDHERDLTHVNDLWQRGAAFWRLY